MNLPHFVAMGFSESSLFLLFCSFFEHLSHSTAILSVSFFSSSFGFHSHRYFNSSAKIAWIRSLCRVQWAIRPWSIHFGNFSALKGLKFGTYILYLQDVSFNNNKRYLFFLPSIVIKYNGKNDNGHYDQDILIFYLRFGIA